MSTLLTQLFTGHILCVESSHNKTKYIGEFVHIKEHCRRMSLTLKNCISITGDRVTNYTSLVDCATVNTDPVEQFNELMYSKEYVGQHDYKVQIFDDYILATCQVYNEDFIPMQMKPGEVRARDKYNNSKFETEYCTIKGKFIWYKITIVGKVHVNK